MIPSTRFNYSGFYCTHQGLLVSIVWTQKVFRNQLTIDLLWSTGYDVSTVGAPCLSPTVVFTVIL